MDPAARVGLGIHTQVAGASGGIARRAAIAGEVALGEDLDEVVLAVALDGAGVADASGIVRRGGVLGRRVACQAGKDGLLERAEDLGTVFDALIDEG